MKKIKLSKFFKSSNAKRTIAIMMALMMLLLASCTTTPEKKPVDSSNPSNVSSEPVSDGTDNTEDLSSGNSSSVNPYDGVITADSDIKSNTERTDKYEIEPIVDGSNLSTNYKGYAEKERNKLLKEILNTPNTEEFYKDRLKGRIYYVSTKGNDANDGLSPETPIQTLEAIDSLIIEKGDAVLFERGCIWRIYEIFNVRTGVTYGSYGEGRKPMFYGSPKNFAQEIWKPSKKKNVWQTSYMYTYPGHIVFNQGEEHGYRKLSIGAVEKNTDFYVDETIATLYIYCDRGNPAEVWESIEVGGEHLGFKLSTGTQDVVIDNLAFRYTSGIGGHYNNNNWSVTNCEIGFTGGGRYQMTGRAGNGIGTWVGGENLYWCHNWIYQTFDTAISPQGNVGKNLFNYHDIYICNNLMEYNNCDIETWETCDDPEKGGPSDFYNYYMDNNICRFTSLGWGTRADDGGIRGIDGVHYGRFLENQITGHVSFSNNIIDCPGRWIYKFSMGNKAVYDAWIRENNVYYIKQSLRTIDSLTESFYWADASNRVKNHVATTKQETLDAFAQFEPDATVYWYK